ncbi:hypothetical protein CRUP_021720 [Coryphaenoides rupestris]|nr:hypothetical protein CRUP_021720 [Coryphaenoides rupestris]
MDKEKPADGSGQCSWFEMQQFIGDLLSSGNASSQAVKEQHELLHVSWGLAGGGEYLGLKGPAQDSCPFSTSPPSYETLKTHKPLYSQAHADKTCVAKATTSTPAMNLSLCLPDDNTSEPSSTTTTSDLKPRTSRRDDKERGTDCSSSRGLAGSFPHFPMFACLGCHGLQTCAQLLRQQDGPDSGAPQAHGNAHGHHFHHHHCPFSSCLPCPQLGHSHPHAAPLRGHFPYLGCQHSFGACQPAHKSGGQKPGTQQQQEEGGRTAGFTNLAAIRFHYRTVHGLTYEAPGRSAAGTQYRDPSNPGCPSRSAGRPRSGHPPDGLLGKCNLAEGEAAMMPGGPAAQGASAKHQSDGHKQNVMYACEDCGQGFKDAPSRNRHQNLVHYTDQVQEAGQTKG